MSNRFSIVVSEVPPRTSRRKENSTIITTPGLDTSDRLLGYAMLQFYEGQIGMALKSALLKYGQDF